MRLITLFLPCLLLAQQPFQTKFTDQSYGEAQVMRWSNHLLPGPVQAVTPTLEPKDGVMVFLDFNRVLVAFAETDQPVNAFVCAITFLDASGKTTIRREIGSVQRDPDGTVRGFVLGMTGYVQTVTKIEVQWIAGTGVNIEVK